MFLPDCSRIIWQSLLKIRLFGRNVFFTWYNNILANLVSLSLIKFYHVWKMMKNVKNLFYFLTFTKCNDWIKYAQSTKRNFWRINHATQSWCSLVKQKIVFTNFRLVSKSWKNTVETIRFDRNPPYIGRVGNFA